jgi:hypothetical protein
MCFCSLVLHITELHLHLYDQLDFWLNRFCVSIGSKEHHSASVQTDSLYKINSYSIRSFLLVID